MNKNKYDKKIGILDWLIFISILVMFIMVYVPQSIWAEENEYKKLRREKMKVISQAEDFYYELTGTYSTNYNQVFSLVEAAMDSLYADSLFVGRKTININNIEYDINMETGYDIIVDTTFSSIEKNKITTTDTIYTILLNNIQSNNIDTILVNSRNFKKYKNDSLFIDVLKSDTEIRTEIDRNQLRKKYHLNNNLIYCPISKHNQDKKFILEIEKSLKGDSIFKITSPVSSEDSERRYGIFKYNPGKSESIIAGQKSWAGN